MLDNREEKHTAKMECVMLSSTHWVACWWPTRMSSWMTWHTTVAGLVMAESWWCRPRMATVLWSHFTLESWESPTPQNLCQLLPRRQKRLKVHRYCLVQLLQTLAIDLIMWFTRTFYNRHEVIFLLFFHDDYITKQLIVWMKVIQFAAIQKSVCCICRTLVCLPSARW